MQTPHCYPVLPKRKGTQLCSPEGHSMPCTMPIHNG